MTTGEWLASAAGRMRSAGVGDARRHALLLLARATARDKAALLAHPEAPVPPAALSVAEALLERRVRREPLQYILGVQEFWGLEVRVGPGCLIPRPETEHLVEAALRLMAGRQRPFVVELGTGSGCVLMALAKERPDARLLGIEREEPAMRWSRLNLASRPGVQLLPGDLEAPPPLDGVDLLVSNPPYITDGEWDGLDPEVRDHEPPAALRCGADALGPYRALASLAASALTPGGYLLCELGLAQARRASALRRLHKDLLWREGIRDLAGRLRVAAWERVNRSR